MAAVTSVSSATSAGPCPCCGSRTCCPFGDPPDDICLTFSGDDWFSNPNPVTTAGCGTNNGTPWWAGNSYTLTRQPPFPFDCQWTWTTTILGVVYSIGASPSSVTGTWAVVLGLSGTTTYSLTTGQITDPGICGTTTNYGQIMSCRCGTPEADYPEVSTCLPTTLTGLTGASSVPSVAGLYWPGTIDIVAGACGGPLMTAAAKSSGAATPPRPCRFQGEDVGGLEREVLRLGHRRRWLKCGRPGFERLGLPVTDCRSCGTPAGRRCGPRWCPGYEPASDG